MAVIRVHGKSGSSSTTRVVACLYEKDLDFEFVPVDMVAGDRKKEPFISMNPFGQVPAFEDGDLKLFDSRAITQYIAQEYSDRGTQLIYQETKQKSIILMWKEVEAHQFNPAASKLTWELIIKPMLGMATDQTVVEENEAKLGKVLDVYEERLSKSKYLAGECFTLADLHHLPGVQYLQGTLVNAWAANITARPAWSKVQAFRNKV
ncbi:hypothetical protein UlMin_031251 [Ulmus minor]